MNDLKVKLKKLFSGNFTEDFLKKVYGPLCIAVFFGSLVISALIFTNYNLATMDISYLGGPWRNPIGWIVWSIGFFITGVLSIPITSYIKRKITTISKKRADLGCFLLYLSNIGMIGLGAIPQFGGLVFGAFHLLNAGLGFGCMYFGLLILNGALRQDPNSRKKSFIVLGVCLGTIIGFATTQIIRFSLGLPNNSAIWIINFSLWEWMLLFGVFASYVLFLFIIPED